MKGKSGESISSFFQTKTSNKGKDVAAAVTPPTESQPECESPCREKQRPHAGAINKYACDNETLKAGILWTIRTISSHSSYLSNENISALFKEMFPEAR